MCSTAYRLEGAVTGPGEILMSDLYLQLNPRGTTTATRWNFRIGNVSVRSGKGGVSTTGRKEAQCLKKRKAAAEVSEAAEAVKGADARRRTGSHR